MINDQKQKGHFLKASEWNEVARGVKSANQSGGPESMNDFGGTMRRRNLQSSQTTFRAKTQEDAPALSYISVKLVDSNDTEIGAAFNAYAIFSDTATQMDECLPLVVTGKIILVQEIDGVWIIVNPTFIDASDCP